MNSNFPSRQSIGKVAEIWRFPVSSLQGERCEHVEIGLHGIYGDRRFGLFDAMSGEVAAPEQEARWRPALFLRSAVDGHGVWVEFPSGERLYLEDPKLRPELEEYFGFAVGIGCYMDDDPLAPSLPTIKNRYSVSPLHLVTSSSLEDLQQMAPDTTVDRLRFRANVLLETEDMAEFPEHSWIGHIISIGGLDLKVTEATKRCGMILAAQPGLPEQPEVLRTIVRKTGRKFGIYCDPLKTGYVETGALAKLMGTEISGSD